MRVMTKRVKITKILKLKGIMGWVGWGMGFSSGIVSGISWAGKISSGNGRT